MAPLRRYIRLTPHTTIQTLIFLEDPSNLHTWLIHPTKPALPRIVTSLRDLILPKLREERDRERTAAVTGSSSSSSKKLKPVKDVVAGSDFEVSVFFKDGANRHALVMPRREFVGPKTETKLRSNSSKMVLGNDYDAMNVGELDPGSGSSGGGGGQEDGSQIANLRIENEDEDAFDLHALPLAGTLGDVEPEQQTADVSSVPTRRSHRKTKARGNVDSSRDEDMDQLFGDEGRAEEQATTPRRRGPHTGTDATRKNSKKKGEKEYIMVDSASDSEAEMGKGVGKQQEPAEDTKKPLFRTTYEAYTIYGKILYLIVKRLDVPDTAVQSEEVPSPVVTRDIPIAPGIEDTGTTDDVMEGWMYMSQAIRQEADF
ncbi:hypothetical protein TWF694_004042 [Orbilia ellipsospora]|uniref:Uncharacterized protein n=1 Tax=Orbilia ellipsospora TaxID=2528407 RepID=A0AAV9WY87_9PEZI